MKFKTFVRSRLDRYLEQLRDGQPYGEVERVNDNEDLVIDAYLAGMTTVLTLQPSLDGLPAKGGELHLSQILREVQTIHHTSQRRVHGKKS